MAVALRKLRSKAIRLYESGVPTWQIADRVEFAQVATSTVYYWIKQHREGKLAAR